MVDHLLLNNGSSDKCGKHVDVRSILAPRGNHRHGRGPRIPRTPPRSYRGLWRAPSTLGPGRKSGRDPAQSYVGKTALAIRRFPPHIASGRPQEHSGPCTNTNGEILGTRPPFTHMDGIRSRPDFWVHDHQRAGRRKNIHYH